MAFSFGGGKSSSESSSSQDVWDAQTPFFEQMYGQMGDLWSGMGGMFNQFGDMAGGMAPWMQDTMQGAKGGYEDMLGGGSYGNTDDILSRLYGSMDSQAGGTNMGKMYDSIVGGSGNTYIDPMVDAMKSSGMENLDRMKSGGAMDAAAMGQGGSSRHAMSDAMMSRDMNKDMMDRETMMRGGAYDKDLSMKMDIAKMADQGVGNQQDRLLSMLQGRDKNVGAGMDYGGMMQNLGMGSMAPMMQAMMMPWQMMGMYSGAMGDPTVLTESKGKGSSGNIGFGVG